MNALPHQHELETLVSTQSVVVQRCSCGAMHLHLGNVTLHVDEREFAHITAALQAAMAQARARQMMAGGVPGEA